TRAGVRRGSGPHLRFAKRRFPCPAHPASSDAAGPRSPGKLLAKQQLRMSSWIVRELADDLKSVSLVERRGLERVRVESDLRATMTSCVFLRGSEQPAPEIGRA